MNAARLLAEIRARGASVRVEADRLRVRPKAKVIDLAPLILAKADEIAEAIRRGPGCIDCGADLGPSVAAGLCFPCRQRRNPGATPVDALPPEAWRARAEERPVYTFRVEVDACEPVPGPVDLRPGVRVVDVPKAIQSMFSDLHQAALTYGEAVADGGDDRLYRLAVEAGEDIERLTEDLARLGCRVRVVGVQ